MVLKENMKIHFLIDYENVGSTGFIGADLLCKEDYVTVFYNSSGTKIERMHIDAVEKLAGGFEIIKLIAPGKNALDFYIAVMVGQIIQSNPEYSIVIISKDKGFKSISDYCACYTNYSRYIISKENIEAGIVACDEDGSRKGTIIKRRQNYPWKMNMHHLKNE